MWALRTDDFALAVAPTGAWIRHDREDGGLELVARDGRERFVVLVERVEAPAAPRDIVEDRLAARRVAAAALGAARLVTIRRGSADLSFVGRAPGVMMCGTIRATARKAVTAIWYDHTGGDPAELTARAFAVCESLVVRGR